MKTAPYYFGLSLLMTHELDAVRAAEWKLLYGLRELPDAAAFSWFVAAHVPLFFAFLWFSHHSNRRIRMWFRVAVSVFLVVHSALHFRLAGDAHDPFSGWLSNSLIFGAGLAGLVLVLLSLRQGRPGTDRAGGRRLKSRRSF